MAKTSASKTSTKETTKTPKPSTRAIKACPCVKDAKGNPLVIREFKTDIHEGQACEECFLVMNFKEIENANHEESP